VVGGEEVAGDRHCTQAVHNQAGSKQILEGRWYWHPVAGVRRQVDHIL